MGVNYFFTDHILEDWLQWESPDAISQQHDSGEVPGKYFVQSRRF